MQIVVTRVTGWQLTLEEVDGDWTVEQLMDEIEQSHNGIPSDSQLLSFNGVRLLSGTKLSDYNIHHEACLQLAERRPVDPEQQQGSVDHELSLLCGAGDGLRARWRLLSEAKANLEERKQALMVTNSGGPLQKKLKLNVGGELFEVRREVLCDAVPQSHLAQLFSGRWETQILTDSDGVPFLDSNPECFSAIVGFLKARLKDRRHAVVPVVADELVPTLHRLLEHFGLGHLFAEPDAAIDPERSQPENESERQEEGGFPAEVDAGACLVQEREHRAAENESVELPARSIDQVISARYGSLDEPGKWIDVTRALVELVDEEGGLSVTVAARGFGVDPAPNAQKHLSIRYKPCEDWESESFEDRLKRLQTAADIERAALRRAIKTQRRRELEFEEEIEWVRHYTKAELQSAASEVVELAVGIGRRSRITVKRSSLLLCERSALARHFDPLTALVPPPAPADGVNAPAGSEHSDDSDGDDSIHTGGGAITTIEEDSQCFGKLIDQLRLIAIATPGDPPPPPVVRGHEEAEFAKLLRSYFGGVEDFIKTNGEHRLAGTSVPAALAGHQRFTYNGSADGGILNYIATDGNTVAWSNPFQSERIHVCAHKDLAVATPLNKTVSVACHSYLQPSNPEASPSEQLISKLKWFVGQMSEGAETTGTAWTGEHTQGKWFVVDLSDHGRVCVRSPLNDRSLHLATHLTVIQYGDSFRSRWNTTVCATATIKTMRCGTGNCRGPTQATVPGARSAGTRMIRH